MPHAWLLVGVASILAMGVVGCGEDDKDQAHIAFSIHAPEAKPPTAGPLVRYVNQVVNGKFIAPLPPPAVAHPSVEPVLPDLPPLDKHAKVPEPRRAGAQHPCGATRVGDDEVPLDCMDADYGKIEKATFPLITYAALHGGEAKLPLVVNHRDDGTEGPVRSQVGTEACTAFSLASAVDHSLARWVGHPGNVSVMQLWGQYHHASIAAAKVTREMLLGTEDQWPFDVGTANAWWRGTKPVDQAKMAALTEHPVGVITDIATIPEFRDMRTLKAKLAGGQDIWFAIRAGGYLSSTRLVGAPGARYVADFTTAPKDGGHALALVGYATLPHGTYFLIHNSYGIKWGDGGYAWIHEETLKRNIESALVVDAQPVDPNEGRRPRRKNGHVKCAAGLIPDSISAQCVPPCPDASPRHNGVCAVPHHCAAGYVNLTGACVMAAPKSSGVELGSKIKWSCGPGGCTYVVPPGIADCKAGSCEISCPAPDYRLAQGRYGLTCIE